jgi:hypothetical protein
LRVNMLEFLLDHRLYTSSRVWLTGDWKLHSGRRGGVLSAWVPIVLWMALQCPNLCYSDGHGHTRLGRQR